MHTYQSLRTLVQARFPSTPVTLPRFLLVWALEDPEDELGQLMQDAGLDREGMAAALRPLLEPADPADTELLVTWLQRHRMGPVPARLLWQVLSEKPEHRIYQALARSGLDWEKLSLNLRRYIYERRGFQRSTSRRQSRPAPAPEAASPVPVARELEIVGEIWRWGRDLTALAGDGVFADLCDRPAALEPLLEVLMRRRKGNIALTGPAGVGKTALVELLARRLTDQQVPEPLLGTRLFELNMGQLVAGTRYRGDFEERLEQVWQTLLVLQPALLFIDELHLLWGTGRAEGAPMDAANLLKPFLTLGGVRVIGATTVEEYQRYIARDAALARRFEEVALRPPEPWEVAEMVQKQAGVLGTHHHLNIPPNVWRQAIALTDRFVPNRYQPDKCVDLLDTAAVRVHQEGREEMLATDLLYVLARQTGLPIAALTGDGRAALKTLADRLKQRIVGQDRVIDRLVAALIQRRQDLGQGQRNLGTFLFAGATGVGKTELARVLSQEFCEGRLCHLDMAEYRQPFSVNRLIGVPAGYSDSETEGILTHWLHIYGSGVLLFDEIEKAHPDVHRLLLGLLDNGCMTSARGESLDATQCVIVLTTNALARGGSAEEDASPERLLAAHFPTEFLARFDDVLLFSSLDLVRLRQILGMRLDEACAHLQARGIELVFERERLLGHLLQGLDGSWSGARGMARLLERELLQPVALARLYFEGEMPVRAELGESYYAEGRVEMVASDRSSTARG